jgi:proteic killer suppression protein
LEALIVIENFGNKAARDIWERDASRAVPAGLRVRAKALLTIMHATSSLDDLRIKGRPPNIRLHKLKGDRRDEWSLTISHQSTWRITFKFKNGRFLDVKIEDYHEG